MAQKTLATGQVVEILDLKMNYSNNPDGIFWKDLLYAIIHIVICINIYTDKKNSSYIRKFRRDSLQSHI